MFISIYLLDISLGTLIPTDVTAVQDGPTRILVFWNMSSDATGYKILFESSGGKSGNETLSSGSTTSYILTELENGETYTISITAISPDHPASIPTEVQVALGMGHMVGGPQLLSISL